MEDHDLAAHLLRNPFTATAALIVLMLKNLPDDVRTRTPDAVRNGTGKVELRTRGVERDGARAGAAGRVGTVVACADAGLLPVVVTLRTQSRKGHALSRSLLEKLAALGT